MPLLPSPIFSRPSDNRAASGGFSSPYAARLLLKVILFQLNGIQLICSIIGGAVVCVFLNYRGQVVSLGLGTLEHVLEVHPEVTIAGIRQTLLDPEQVRASSHRGNSELYYRRLRRRRFNCVIVKHCDDGRFISTALTTASPKEGRIIYRKRK